MTNEISTFVCVRVEFYKSFKSEIEDIVFHNCRVRMEMEKCGFYGENNRFVKIGIKLTGEGEQKYLVALQIHQLAVEHEHLSLKK